MVSKTDRYIKICTKTNRFMFAFGIGQRYGLNGGVVVYQNCDWWNLNIGFTVIKVFVTVSFRWRVFGSGYYRKDKSDIYY